MTLEQRKPSDYVIGVDGGNTKTDLSIADLEGNVVFTLRKGTCSHEALPDSFAGAERQLNAFLSELHEQSGIPQSAVASIVLGLAGVDSQQQWERLDDIVSRMGYPCHKVVNDSFLSIHAVSPDGTGICSINGTGTVAGGIDSTGKMLQVGGMGAITGDRGGGSYIAYKAVELAYNQIFRNGPDTALTPRVLEILEMDDPSRFHERIEELLASAPKHHLALMQVLFLLGNEDPVAAGAIRTIATELANSVIGCAGHLHFPDRIHIVCAGSIWQKAETPLLLECFSEHVQAGLSGRAEIAVLKDAPVAGAVKWAIREYHQANA